MAFLKVIKALGVFLAFVVGFAVVCAGGVYTVRSSDPVGAIPKGTLQDWGIQGRLECCIGPGGPTSTPPQEVHLYSWRGPFQKAKEVIGSDLKMRGLKIRTMKGVNDGSVLWEDEQGLQVLIQPGRNNTAEQWARGKGTDKDTWVTVLTSQDLPENWITDIRRIFRDLDW